MSAPPPHTPTLSLLQIASRSGAKLYFTAPETLVAGAPARLYFNRARSWEMRNNPNVRVRHSLTADLPAQMRVAACSSGGVHTGGSALAACSDTSAMRWQSASAGSRVTLVRPAVVPSPRRG